MKKIAIILVFILVLSSFSFAYANEVETELPTLTHIIAKDYASGMEFEELIRRYDLKGDTYKWFFYTFLASLEPIRKKTIHQAIAYDYCNGEDLKIMMERYGLRTVDFAIGDLKPTKNLEETMRYDWERQEDIEVMKKRYGINNEDYFIFRFNSLLKEPNINPKLIMINDWLEGKDYNELKEKYKFKDKWFLDGVKEKLKGAKYE